MVLKNKKKILDNPLNNSKLSPFILCFQRGEVKKKDTTTVFLINWTHGEGTKQSFTFRRAPIRAPHCYPFIYRSGGGSTGLVAAGLKHRQMTSWQVYARLSRSFARLYGYDSEPCKSIQSFFLFTDTSLNRLCSVALIVRTLVKILRRKNNWKKSENMTNLTFSWLQLAIREN